MRILFIGPYKSQNFLTWDGVQGAELGGLRKMPMVFRALLKAGHEVRVVSSAVAARHRYDWQPMMKTTEEFPEGRIEVIHAPTTGLKPWGGLLTCLTTRRIVLQVAREWRPDIAYSYNGLLAEAVSLLSFRRCFQLPLIVEINDFPGVRSRGVNPKAKLDVMGWKYLEPKISGFVLVNSGLLTKIPLGSRPVFILPGIVDEYLLRVAQTRVRPFYRTMRTLMYSGGLSAGRGADRLLQIFPLMPENWRLVVSGSGPLLPDFQRLAQANPERCVCLGFIPVEKMFEALGQADAVINTPELLTTETGVFPFKIMEYIASGGHVISPPLPSVGGLDLKWFQRWNGDPAQMRTILESAATDYEKETVQRNSTIQWVLENYSIAGVARHLNAFLANTKQEHVGN